MTNLFLFKPGSLYRAPEHYFYLYPTKKKAVGSPATMPVNIGSQQGISPETWTEVISIALKCKVGFLNKNELFFVLEKVEGIVYAQLQVKILLSSNGKIGWINVDEWIVFKEEKHVL